jgi:hypothetical protein
MSKDIYKKIDQAWLGLDAIDHNGLFNPGEFILQDIDDFETRLSYIMSRPEYLSFVCKEILNIDLLPTQLLMLQEMWIRKFPMLIATRGFGKSFMLSIYSILRAFILNGRKIVIVGGGFRQSKILFEYMENIWKDSPLLRSICGERGGIRKDTDRYSLKINDSIIVCLPLGDGQKIRGQRAHDIIADEFAIIPREIFENVVAGFGVVSANPVENVKKAASQKKAEEMGLELEKEYINEFGQKIPNQIILSGTAYYDFNHFSEYWKKWKKIIKSRGNKTLLSELFPNGVPNNFNWKDYSIIRIPYELVPEGFMDAEMVARSKATVHSGIYMMEYGAVFTKDSQGFFKMSLIKSCIPSVDNPIKDSTGKEIKFNAMLQGDSNKKYIFGVDPASEVDNFSIVVLELSGDHRKIVHCWTTNRSQHKDMQKMGLSTEKDFYSYCARKIRNLMKRFPCVHIAIDGQGGGIAVVEALHDPDKIEEGEHLIWPVIDENKPQDTDDEKGLHILEVCQFSRSDWLAEANHGLKKDFEDRILLFPFFDGSTIGLATADDFLKERSSDTLEDCVLDIEELKTELSLIEMSQSPNGRDRWDTPEVVTGAGRKKRLRKDRYSALLMANMSARIIERTPDPVAYGFYGGFADSIKNKKDKNKKDELYTGPSWFTDSVKNIY